MSSLPPPSITSSRGLKGKLADRLPTFSLPPQASVSGQIFPNQVLPYLSPCLEKIKDAAAGGKEVILINATSPQKQPFEEGLTTRHDIITFAESVLANVPELSRYKVVVPRSGGNQDFVELVQRVNDADEVKSSDRLYILILTDNCLKYACKDPGEVQKFLTKLNREHFGKIERIDAPAKNTVDINELWATHLGNATTDAFSKALIEAALNPDRHPMEGIYPKLREPYPGQNDAALREKYPDAYSCLLNLLQMSLWYPQPICMILWGEPSTGKSTMIRAAANLYHQLGIGSNYLLIRDSKIRVEGEGVMHATSYSASRPLTCIDQIDEVTGALEINRRGQYESPAECPKILATSNLNPEELIQKTGGQINILAIREDEPSQTLLNQSLMLESAWRFCEPKQHEFSQLISPERMNLPIVAFIRWEGTQWNIQPEIINLAEFLLTPLPLS